MTDWVRLWHDMPTDPKWRVIARKSKQPLPCVIAVFTMMLTNASGNAADRGVLLGWDHEDAGAALDMDAEDVAAIHAAMQGKVLDGDRLTGWERRQPKREDSTAAERKAAWKARKATEENATERSGTHENEAERTREDTETEKSYSVAKATGETPSDPDAKFWADAKAYLAGAGVKNPGGVVGKWVRDHGKRETASAVSRAQIERAVEPVGFVQACFREAKRSAEEVPLC